MLEKLPYDVFLLVASFLDIYDVHSVSLTCRVLGEYALTRPVYRAQAHNLLLRCRPLPLKGFVQLSDLASLDLLHAIAKARRNEDAWKTRAPHPIRAHTKCNYLDVHEARAVTDVKGWFRILRLSLYEEATNSFDEIDWLSTVTTKYLLCSTKNGAIICQNLENGVEEGRWSLGYQWELWKCRVDFDARKACIVMAEKALDPFDEGQVLEWGVAQVDFPGPNEDRYPVFNQVAKFKTRGITLNVFILDTAHRRLAALILLHHQDGATSGSLGLLLIPDWDHEAYAFVDTGLEAKVTTNWTCILMEKEQILAIHREEPTAAYQYIYPLSLLTPHVNVFPGPPMLGATVPPALTLRREFVFPMTDGWPEGLDTVEPSLPLRGTTTMIPASSPLNPYPVPSWYPEASHFIRQWWPKFDDVHRVSCAVLLLGNHNMETHRTTYVLAQYYFAVPMLNMSMQHWPDTNKVEGDPLTLWYIHADFEICSVPESLGGGEMEQRPLIAVDFGHAVWLEYVDATSDDKVLRFATFTSLGSGEKDCVFVRTLETPRELDLNVVESMNFDQSQCAVIVSVVGGRIFILCYE